MKTRFALLISLGLNVSLLAWASVLLRQRWAPSAQVIGQSCAAGPRGESEQASASPAPCGAGHAGVSANNFAFHWRMVESSDYRQYIANLRAIGCPETTVRDIVRADVRELYAQRRREILEPIQRQFWHIAAPPVKMKEVDTLDERLRDLKEERDDVLKELLGEHGADRVVLEQRGAEFGEDQLEFLPREKQEQARLLREKFDRDQEAIQREVRNPVERRAALKNLEAQRLAELGQILTAPELEEYELQTALTARDLRRRLGLFEPTEAEFRQVYQAQKAFDEEFVRYGFNESAPAERARKAAAEKQLSTQIQETLGAERFREYERAQDSSYQAIRDVAERYSWSADTVDRVYELRQTAAAQVAALKDQTALSEERRRAAADAIARELGSTLKEMLGEEAFAVHQQRVGEGL